MKRFTIILLLLTAMSAAWGQTVSRVEYYWDNDPGRGHGTPIAGVSATSQVSVNTTISTAGLTPGVHTLGLRSRASNGMWSPTGLRQVVVGEVRKIEYFYDNDPGYDSGTVYAGYTSGNTVVINNAQLSAAGVNNGLHHLGLRAKGGHNMWSPTYFSTVVVNAAGIAAIEYFFDTDPGFGNGRTYTGFTPSNTVNISNAQLSATGISNGMHQMGLRVKAGHGVWSPTYFVPVVVNDAGIAAIEYFFDSDPGFGNGRSYTGFTPGNSATINNAQLSATGISNGMHQMGLRVKAGHGVWSPTYFVPVVVNDAGIAAIEYFFDTDPGFGNGRSYTGFTPGNSATINNAQLSATGISNGLHQMGLRVKAAHGVWSPTYLTTVLVNYAGISRVEYYWDEQDPGYGQATSYGSFTQNSNQVIINGNLSTAGLSTGMHKLSVRCKTSTGVWSPTYSQEIWIGIGAQYAEYFWDTDPGFGQATAIPFASDTLVQLNLSNLQVPTSYGLHVLNIRARTGNLWGATYYKEYCIGPEPHFSVINGLNDSTACKGAQLIILDETDGADAGTMYTWDMNGDGTPESTSNTDWDYTYSRAGEYTIILGVGNTNECQNTYSQRIKVMETANPSISISRSANNVCAGTEVMFRASTSNAKDYQPRYAWFRNDTLIANSNRDTIYLSDLRQGDRIYAEVHTQNSCATLDSARSSTLTMSVYALPEVTMAHVRYVFTDQTAFTLASYFSATPLGGTYQINGTNATVFNPSRYAEGDYEISYTYTNSRGCSTTVFDTFTLCQRIQYSITALPDDPSHGSVTGGGTYTIGDMVTLTATPSGYYRFVSWNDGNTENPRSFEAAGTATYTALFAINTYQVAVSNSMPVRGSVTGAGTYNDHSLVTLTATANRGYHFEQWSDGNTQNPRTFTITQDTTFAVLWDTDCHDTIVNEYVTACDSYLWHGTTYTASTNSPTFTYTNEFDCDSVVTLHLTINRSNSAIFTAEACDSYSWHGNTYTSSTNTPTFTSTNAAGCDSVTTLHLTINHSNSGIKTVTACNSYTWHGTNYTGSTNTPTYTSTNAAGCDSVTTLHLTINHSNSAVFTATACDSYSWHGNTYTSSTNTPTYTCTNAEGCDSVTTLHLTINYSNSAIFTAEECDSYSWHGNTYTSSTNTPTYTCTNAAGCDSVTTLHLTINHSNSAVETVTACNSYVWHGTNYTASTNTPTYTSINAAGCDSVTTLHLTIEHCSSTHIVACDSYQWNGTTYTTSGTYINGTDTLYLTINHSNSAIFTTEACDSYTWHGSSYTSSTNTPTYTCTNAEGCDSVTTLHLTINYSNSGIETVTACNSYVWHGTNYTASTNTPTYTSTNAAGCDSVTTLHLTIEHCSSTHIVACDSYQWNGTTYTTSGTYINGTDTLYLTINHSNSAIFTTEACDSYTWHGNSYTSSTNTPTYTCTNAEGCDSVTTLHLTINYSNSGIETVTACNSYVWHGTNYTASTNTPTYTSINAAGCDSVTTLHLTIEHCSSTHIVACDSYQWNNTTYTASGTYINGTDTLYLTINHSNSAVFTTTACDSYTWHGSSYTSSTNTPTYTCTNAEGCDSVTTLHLTINYSNSGIETVTACDSYSWHGNTYTSSTNTPTFTSTNAAGCDSVTTLHLTINYTQRQQESKTIYAASYTWHGVEYTQSGVYDDTLTTIFGCDSIVTLNLTLISSFVITATSDDEFSGTVSGGGVYDYGDTALLVATPSEHYHFARWSDGSTQNPRQVVVTQDSLFVASFAIDVHQIVVVSNNLVHGTVQGSGIYEYGSQATISAAANSGYTFVQWDNGMTYNPYTFTVLSDDTIMAIFKPENSITAVSDQLKITPQPNPTNGRVALMQGDVEMAANSLKIEVYSIHGKLLKVIENSAIVDLSEFPAGCYMLRVIALEGNTNIKVVKR